MGYEDKRGADGMTRAERKLHIQRIRDERRGGLTVKAYNALHGILTKKERKAVNAAHDENSKRPAAKPRKAQFRSMRRMVLRTSKGWQPVIVRASRGWDRIPAAVRIDLIKR